MFADLNFTAVLLLGLVLWGVYWLGKLAGSGEARKALQENVYKLTFAKRAAEEEALQCRFACALFKGTLEMQEERLKELKTLEEDRAQLWRRVATLEEELAKTRLVEKPVDYTVTCHG